MENKSTLQRLSGFAFNQKGKAEIIALVGLFLWGLGKPNYPNESDLILVMSLSLLACAYYISTFYRVGYTIKSNKEIFVFKLFHVCAPVVLIGILFTLMGYPNGDTVLIAGIGTMMSVIFMGYGLLKQRSNLIDKNFMLRAFVLFLLPIILYILRLTNS